MASASVTGAVIERYQTFTVAATVPIYFGEIPTRGTANAAVNPPYVLLEDLGTTPAYDFEHNPIETTKLRFTVYAVQLSDVDAHASALRYNAGAVNAGAGMDFAASLPLTGMVLVSVEREREVRGVTTRPVDLLARPVHFCRLDYSVTVKRTA